MLLCLCRHLPIQIRQNQSECQTNLLLPPKMLVSMYSRLLLATFTDTSRRWLRNTVTNTTVFSCNAPSSACVAQELTPNQHTSIHARLGSWYVYSPGLCSSSAHHTHHPIVSRYSCSLLTRVVNNNTACCCCHWAAAGPLARNHLRSCHMWPTDLALQPHKRVACRIELHTIPVSKISRHVISQALQKASALPHCPQTEQSPLPLRSVVHGRSYHTLTPHSHIACCLHVAQQHTCSGGSSRMQDQACSAPLASQQTQSLHPPLLSHHTTCMHMLPYRSRQASARLVQGSVRSACSREPAHHHTDQPLLNTAHTAHA